MGGLPVWASRCRWLARCDEDGEVDVKEHHTGPVGGGASRAHLPPGSSAIVAVVEDSHLDRVDKALSRSAKKVSKAIDSGGYDKLKLELGDAGSRIADAIEA